MNSCYLDSGNKALCCGCKACSFVCAKKAISFIYDEEGFWYPVIDEKKCIKCNLCRKVCPLNDEKLSVILDKNQTYAAYAKSAMCCCIVPVAVCSQYFLMWFFLKVAWYSDMCMTPNAEQSVYPQAR